MRSASRITGPRNAISDRISILREANLSDSISTTCPTRSFRSTMDMLRLISPRVKSSSSPVILFNRSASAMIRSHIARRRWPCRGDGA